MKAIGVEEARRAVLSGVKPLGLETLPLGQCLGRILVGTLRSSYDYPLRDVSAMDGFAFRHCDLGPEGLVLTGERKAGDAAGGRIAKGEAVRIMTGAPLPPGADSVIPKETVWMEGLRVFLKEKLPKGSHLRYRGEGMRKGRKVLLPPGPLTARSLGFLASLGFSRLKVRRKPLVSVIVTGDELVKPGERPGPSGIFESNGLMLGSALREMGLEAKVTWVADKPAAIARAVASALKDCDLLLTTGGVSVGERDWAKEAFHKAGVRQVFWRVAQKPGGPLYFGRKADERVLGLPGNPAAVYSCFHLYARPLLEGWMGLTSQPSLRVRLLQAVTPLPKKTFFAKAKLEERKTVRVLSGQGSHLLEMLSSGDGLLEVPPGKGVYRKSTSLLFHPFPPSSAVGR